MGRARGGSLFPAITQRGPTTSASLAVLRPPLSDRGHGKRPGTDGRYIPPPCDFVDGELCGSSAGGKHTGGKGGAARRSQIEKWPSGPVAAGVHEPQPPAGKPAAPRFLASIEARLEADLAAVAAGGGEEAAFEVWQHHFQRCDPLSLAAGQHRGSTMHCCVLTERACRVPPSPRPD